MPRSRPSAPGCPRKLQARRIPAPWSIPATAQAVHPSAPPPQRRHAATMLVTFCVSSCTGCGIGRVVSVPSASRPDSGVVLLSCRIHAAVLDTVLAEAVPPRRGEDVPSMLCAPTSGRIGFVVLLPCSMRRVGQRSSVSRRAVATRPRALGKYWNKPSGSVSV